MHEPTRPSWDEYFLAIAKTVASRADCTRAKCGAVIVRENRIVSTGYNGSPAGGLSCLRGECPRGRGSYQELAGFQSGNHNYELGASACIALHAEANAILYALRHDLVCATIYVTRLPCLNCWKLIDGSRIANVICPEGSFDVSNMQWPYGSTDQNARETA